MARGSRLDGGGSAGDSAERLELLRETCDCGDYAVTAQEAEDALLTYLSDFPGQLLPEWSVLNRICKRGNRSQNHLERVFFMKQLNRMVRERKIIRYRGMCQRGKIRISEAFVRS